MAIAGSPARVGNAFQKYWLERIIDAMIAKRDSWAMFNRIANTYDVTNRIVSLGIDQRWRRQLVGTVATHQPLALLDLGTGTGDVARLLADRFPDATIYAIDPAAAMLAIGQEKSGDDSKIIWTLGAGEHIPLPDGSIHHVTMSFSLRNVPDLDQTLGELYRVLAPNGRFSILEFGLPSFLPIRWVYLAYFRYLLPFIGGIVSGDRPAYRYLNTSVEAFPYGDALCQRFTATGFLNARCRSLTFGVAMIYEGEKG
ncbi:ubiquinone/menaquinone biosynthesis methyltransferase [bacterium]|nr:ubiquinone/menaquinone biosynthesis methyltransferase [bacterium]